MAINCHFFGAAARACPDSDTSTQSSFPGPSAFWPGDMNRRVPWFFIGEPAISWNFPEVGSYQRAVTGPLSLVMSTAMVRLSGRYLQATDPDSGAHHTYSTCRDNGCQNCILPFWPFSTREIKAVVRPERCESCSWVRPASWRRRRTTSPNSFFR